MGKVELVRCFELVIGGTNLSCLLYASLLALFFCLCPLGNQALDIPTEDLREVVVGVEFVFVFDTDPHGYTPP